MKCLKVVGTDNLIDEFVAIFNDTLQSRTICVISACEAGEREVSFPGSPSALRIMQSMPPDIVILRNDKELTAPVVNCSAGDIEDDPMLLARYNGNENSIDPEDILAKMFDLLPQKTAEECGRCGLDCRRLAEGILRGEKRVEDCFYAPGDVEVKLGGRLVELGSFPAGIIEGAVRGLVASLKGYSEKNDISVTIKS